MMAMKWMPTECLGLPGIGPKAMQNIEETIAGVTFPEPPPAELVVEPVAEAELQPEAVAEAEAVAPVAVEEVPVPEKQVPAKKDPRKVAKKRKMMSMPRMASHWMISSR